MTRRLKLLWHCFGEFLSLKCRGLGNLIYFAMFMLHTLASLLSTNRFSIILDVFVLDIKVPRLPLSTFLYQINHLRDYTITCSMYLKHITASASLLKVHVIDRIKSLLFYNLVELQIHKWVDTHWLNFFILCNLFHC